MGEGRTMRGRRYPDLTAVDDYGVTIHHDLCRPCAVRWLAEGVVDDTEMEFPEVDYEDGYRCGRCDRRIASI